MNEVTSTPHVIAITGGKGGVGKTSIAVNLAIALSRAGSKVCLFDGDISLANTNVMLGLYPAYTLEHLFSGERSIQEIVINGPGGIQIVPGASGVANCVELDSGQQQRLVTSIRAIEKHYDYLLVDTAAGIGPTVLHFIAASQVAVIVITPEPTSLTDAFSLLKVLKRRGYRRKVQIIVNMATSPAQMKKTFARFAQAVDKYLNLKTEFLGAVWMDESMRNAVATQRPVALYPKTDPSARGFYRIAEQLEAVFDRPSTPKLAFSDYWQKVIERQHKGRVFNSQGKLLQNQTEAKSDQDALTQVQKQLLAKVNRAQEERLITQYPPIHADKKDEPVDISPDSPIHLEPGDYVPYPNDSYIQSTDAEHEHSSASPTKQRNRPDGASRGNGLDSPLVGGDEKIAGNSAQLEENSEQQWLDLRVRMNRFVSDENSTPEQFLTLFSSAIYSFGDRLQNASVDLLHGLMHSLDPEKLSDEQKQLLLNDYERIGLDKFKKQQDSRLSKARYDAQGFGDQQALVQAIRSSAADLPLESLLESIKYASLVDSNSK